MAALLDAITHKEVSISIVDGKQDLTGSSSIKLYSNSSQNAYFLLVDQGLAGLTAPTDTNSRYLEIWRAVLASTGNSDIDTEFMQQLTAAWVTKTLKGLGISNTGPSGPLSRAAVADAAELHELMAQQDILRILLPLAQSHQQMQTAMQNAAYALRGTH